MVVTHEAEKIWLSRDLLCVRTSVRTSVRPSVQKLHCACVSVCATCGLNAGKRACASGSTCKFNAHQSFSSPEPLGFTHHYEWLWLQPKIRIFSLANETQCALGIKLQSTAHFRCVINCNVVVFKNQRVYKRTCFSFKHFERR